MSESLKLLDDVEIPFGWQVIEVEGHEPAFACTSAHAGTHGYVTLEVLRRLAATVGLVLVPVSKSKAGWDDVREEPCGNCGGRSRKSTAGCDHCDHEEK